jgi:microcystin-dependent protein
MGKSSFFVKLSSIVSNSVNSISLLPFLVTSVICCSICSQVQAQNEALYIDNTGNVGIGKAADSLKLEVNGKVKADGLYVNGFSYNALVPSGAVIMWAGSKDAIPKGWVLCDGNNGSPDLRSRFIVGYDNRTTDPGGNYWDAGYQRVGYKGGEIQKTLSVNEMPSHSHTGTTDNSGAHTHYWRGYRDKCVCAGQSSVRSREQINSDPKDAVTSNDGAHQHNLNVNNTGGGQSFDKRAPFYTLIFIYKL